MSEHDTISTAYNAIRQQPQQLELWPAPLVGEGERQIERWRRLLRYAGQGKSLREYWQTLNPQRDRGHGWEPIPFDEWFPNGDLTL